MIEKLPLGIKKERPQSSLRRSVRLISKTTKIKLKYQSNQSTLSVHEPDENPSTTDVSLEKLSQECATKPGATKKEPEGPSSSTGLSINHGPLPLEVCSSTEEDDCPISWQKAQWEVYLNHTGRVFIQEKDSVTPHILCLVCKKFCKESKILQSLLHGEPFDSSTFKYFAPDHYQTKEELDISASKGCHMCTLIRYGVRPPYDDFKFRFQRYLVGPGYIKYGKSRNFFGEFIFHPLLNENSQCKSCLDLHLPLN